MTNTLNTPAEAIELQYPLRIRAFQRANGSGGDGAFTGGDGIIREIEALADCEGTIISDRNLSQPYGLSGGTAARAGSHAVISASGAVDLAGKSRFYLRRGDVLRVITPGGGGFGKHV
jgi:N-methylhydantoinase B